MERGMKYSFMLYYVEVSRHLHVPAALPEEKDPCTHWIEDWTDPRAGLDAVKRKISFQCRKSNLGSQVTEPTQIRIVV
jgi:hypothetical protein